MEKHTLKRSQVNQMSITNVKVLVNNTLHLKNTLLNLPSLKLAMKATKINDKAYRNMNREFNRVCRMDYYQENAILPTAEHQLTLGTMLQFLSDSATLWSREAPVHKSLTRKQATWIARKLLIQAIMINAEIAKQDPESFKQRIHLLNDKINKRNFMISLFDRINLFCDGNENLAKAQYAQLVETLDKAFFHRKLNWGIMLDALKEQDVNTITHQVYMTYVNKVK